MKWVLVLYIDRTGKLQPKKSHKVDFSIMTLSETTRKVITQNSYGFVHFADNFNMQA